MARRLRMDEPDSWHHVINRGIAKRPLFETRAEARHFLSRLAIQVRVGRIEVHAYCLMTTHFHLLLRSPIGELSEAMRLIQSAYTKRFNRSHRRDGPLIRGRFFSQLVDTIEYRRTLVRYIDHNPVKAGLAQYAHEYELSSAAHYLQDSGPRWMTRTWVEAEARHITSRPSYSPATYTQAFGVDSAAPPDDICEWVEARMRSRVQVGAVQSLIADNPIRVQAWMQRKAKLADGHRVDLPLTCPSSLKRALEADQLRNGTWIVEDAGTIRLGKELVWIGGLHDLCALPWGTVAQHVEHSINAVRRRARHHNRLMLTHPDYAQRASMIGYAAIDSIDRFRPATQSPAPRS